ncbi:MAG: hypothetical protein HRT54_07725, partial [Colwellia sp.]|nr:hypothetical protein [Colwellia sp.]
DSMAAAPAPEVVDEGPAELTDPDDIDALMDSMATASTEPTQAVVDEGLTELTDPEDIDALMDSMVKESAIAELDEKSESFEMSDPDDIDALLDSMADPDQVSKPITADDIVDPLDDVTTPDEIVTTEEENKALIENFTSDYVSPFLSVDFSELLTEVTEDANESSDEAITEKNSAKDNSLSDDLDIDALLAEAGGSENSDTDLLDIGDDILGDGQINELVSENSTDYTNGDVLADLLTEENTSETDSVDENSEMDVIEELDNVDFDDLLANIEEDTNALLSDEADLSVNFTTDDIDLDAIDFGTEDSNSEINIEFDNEDDFSLGLDDALDIGDDIVSDNNLDVDFNIEEDDFVSVDSLLSDTSSSTKNEEPYRNTDFDLGLDEFPEFSGDNFAEEDDDNGIAAKLDLAKVYIEIGDSENAEVILQDVVEKGDAQQQFDAQQLLDNIS